MFRTEPLSRRQFAGICGLVPFYATLSQVIAKSESPNLLVGQGKAEITPPLGVELAGFHRPPGNERRAKGIRQPTYTRVLHLRCGQAEAVICSLEVLYVSHEFAESLRRDIAAKTGVPLEHVRIACTHTHSMPSFCYLRQWGAIPQEFVPVLRERVVQAACQAKEDLAPAEVLVGQSVAIGGSHNRTTKDYKTEDAFSATATDETRWLDRALQVMLFPRQGKPTLCWYHFSAHAVCYADELAGPDWPGEVAERIKQDERLEPVFLQGHCGDVNPGDGSDWRGEIRQTVSAIYPALKQAIAAAKSVRFTPLGSARAEIQLPFDLERFEQWRTKYRQSPDQCRDGEWVDAGFAKAWFEANADRKPPASLPITLSALRFGDIGMVFHPSELYSYYGLATRRDSPFPTTLVVGYSDGCAGYLPDPTAFKNGEYSALVVPKILDFPPFAPDAARQMTAVMIGLLKGLV